MFRLLLIILHCAFYMFLFFYASHTFPINFLCFLFIVHINDLCCYVYSLEAGVGGGWGHYSVLLSLLKIIKICRRHSYKLVLLNWRSVSESLPKHTYVWVLLPIYWLKTSKSWCRHVHFVKTPQGTLIHYL